MDKDLGNSLQMIRLELIEKESSRQVPPSSGHDGFVHTIGIYPLVVHMWNESQVRLWHGRCKNDISYLDATGTLIADHGGKRVLYYALVIRHPVEGEPPLPVAEMVTSDQSAGNIRTFIERFRRDESRLYNGHMSGPRQINTDYSRAILLAVLKEFNNETMVNFLARAFRIVNKRGLETDFTLTIPHVGCSHFMHIVHKKIKQLARVERTIREEKKDDYEDLVKDIWYRFNMYSMSLLVNARTLYEFDTILEDVVIFLTSQKQTEMLQAAYRRVSGRINNMDKVRVKQVTTEFPKEDADAESPNKLEDSLSESLFSNPFTKYFEKKLKGIKERVQEDSRLAGENKNANRSYCPHFLEFIEKHIAEMPLWSGVLLGNLERYQTNSSQNETQENTPLFLAFSSENSKSEGYIESAMRNLKQEDFPGRKRLRADVFVHENYDRIRRRERNYADRLHTYLLPQKNSSATSEEKSFHKAEEKWGKKDPETPKLNPKIGRYQQSPTIPLSQNPDLKKAKSKVKSQKDKATKGQLFNTSLDDQISKNNSNKNRGVKRKLNVMFSIPSKQIKTGELLTEAHEKDKNEDNQQQQQQKQQKKQQQQQQPQRDVNLEKLANDRNNCVNNIEGNRKGLNNEKEP